MTVELRGRAVEPKGSHGKLAIQTLGHFWSRLKRRAEGKMTVT